MLLRKLPSGALQVGQRPGHTPHAVQAARAEAAGTQAALEETGGAGGESRHIVKASAGELRSLVKLMRRSGL